MKPYIHDEDLFMWNLNGSVGRGGSNSFLSDVSYLQWYYTLAAVFPETPVSRKTVYQAVRITGACTGQDNDPLVKAIYVHQQGLRHAFVDGRADVVPGVAGDIRMSGKAYFVIRLGARFSTMFPNVWPRLDLIPGCPASVAADVRRAIPVLR